MQAIDSKQVITKNTFGNKSIEQTLRTKVDILQLKQAKEGS